MSDHMIGLIALVGIISLITGTYALVNWLNDRDDGSDS